MLTPKRRFLRIASITSVVVPSFCIYFALFWIMPSEWFLDSGPEIYKSFFSRLFKLDLYVFIPGIVMHAAIGVIVAFALGALYLIDEKNIIAQDAELKQKEATEKEQKIDRVYRELEEMNSKKRFQIVSLSTQQKAL